MTKEEMLEMLDELKFISAEIENCLSELQKFQEDDTKRVSVTLKIEQLTSSQSDIMSRFISLCNNKELLDNFEKISEEKERLFLTFAEAKTENELIEIEKKIIKTVELWIKSFQSIVSSVLGI